MSGEKIKIGIIGGSGFYSMPELENVRVVKNIETEFGKPASDIVEGVIDGTPCAVLTRHGKNHQYNPSEVNYRANILALKDLGVTHILAGTACGSLREELAPGHFVVIDSFIDRTTKRVQTFHTQEQTSNRFGTVCHMAMHPSFCPTTAAALYEAAKAVEGVQVSPKGTMVTIEGPRFSSRAESRMFRAWGGDVINMTTVPEVVLAKELGISYAALAMVTDFDCWRDNEEAVDVTKVMATMKANVTKARKVIVEAVKRIKAQDWTTVIAENEQRAKTSVLSWPYSK